MKEDYTVFHPLASSLNVRKPQARNGVKQAAKMPINRRGL